MSYFTNPYSQKPQMVSGMLGLAKDIASIIALLTPATAPLGAAGLASNALGGGQGSGTMGTMGGMAGQNILDRAPQDMAPGPTYPQPPQANMIPQGQTPLGGQGGIPPELLAYLRKMMMGQGGQFGQGF